MRRGSRLGVAFGVVLLSLGVVASGCGGGDTSQGFPDGGGDATFDSGHALDGTADARDSSVVDSGIVDTGIADAGIDSRTDAGVDSGGDAAADAAQDSGVDTGSDAGSDAATDTGSDAGADGGADAGRDAPADSASDAPLDAPSDANVPDAPPDSGFDGGMMSKPLILLAGGFNSTLGASFDGTSWTTTALSGITVDDIALTVTSAVQGVGLIRFTQFGNPADQELWYVTWSAGTWGTFAQVAADTTMGAPTITSSGAVAQAVFQGLDFKYYYASFDGSTWSPTAEPVGGSMSQSYGPIPPSLAALGSGATLVFVDGSNNNDLTAQDRTGGAWQTKVDVTTGPNFGVSPALIAMSSGPELMAAWIDSAANGIHYATRTGGVWSAPGTLVNAFSTSPPALLALPGGGALLAFEGTDMNLYDAVYAPGGTWGAVSPVDATPLSLASAPSLAAGVGGKVAEIAFVQNDGVAYHARFDGSAWSLPAAVGGTALSAAAIASAP